MCQLVHLNQQASTNLQHSYRILKHNTLLTEHFTADNQIDQNIFFLNNKISTCKYWTTQSHNQESLNLNYRTYPTQFKF